uniref:HMG mating-type protein MAT1-2-1 n=1 Tax=Aspergillus lentulus TaxID=293939 RepID=S5S0E5_ASPLE|nr:HMG mating-type protein MAT1-2-1 [Aspergillus lentulus]
MATVPIAMKSAAESTDTLTELLWQDALRHLESTNNEVLLPINVTDMIGQDNVDKIKTRLGALIGAPVVAFVDESIKALRVMRTPAFSGTAVSVASHGAAVKTDKVDVTESFKPRGKPAGPMKAPKVPRPPNAFILYRQHHHPKIKEAYPDFSNNDISIMLGKQWKDEDEEVKAQFRTLAEELKKKHAEDHPDYHYTPRKPSERKRRVSSRQFSKNTMPAALLDTPASTNIPSDVSTPAMLQGMPVGDIDFNAAFEGVPGMDAIMTHNGMPEDQQYHFEPNAFDLMHQMQNDYNKAALYQQLSLPHGQIGENFEFTDFISDCF